MALPVIENILADVVTSLEDVTQDSGYHNDLKPQRPKPNTAIDPTVWENGTAMVLLGPAQSEDDAPHQYQQWRQTVTVRCKVSDNDNSDLLIDTQLLIVAADVHKALLGTNDSRKRNGWAIATFPGDVTPQDINYEANEGIVDVDVQIQYRHNYGDPFTCPFRT